MKQFTQNRLLVSIVAVLLLANLALLLYLFVFRKDHNEHPPRRPVSEFVQKQLGFSKEQSDKFQQLRDQHKEAVKPLMQEMQKLKDSLFSSLQSPTANDSTARILAGKIGLKQQELELMTYHHFQQVRLICNSDQLPKFDSLVHNMINRGPWGKRSSSSDNKRP